MVVSLVAGFLAGFFGSMPVAGPIAVLIVTLSLQHRARDAVLIGWGAALPEAAYAFLAYWGFSSFLADVPILVPLSSGLATVILLVLARWLARYRPPEDPDLAPVPQPGRGARSFLMGLSIAALNPTLILTWTAVLGLVASLEILELEPRLALPFSAAAAVGMGTWCALAAGLVSRFRARLSHAVIVKVHRWMAVFVFALAVYFAVNTIRSL